ncbi:MAG: hypothetical protein FWD45_07210 [Coriobacteriia bacterium]|nr:hypothetical protein [Coriobacteriia bacterium]
MGADNRIVILGSPASGKSTLALQLGELLATDVIHLDQLFWNPGWVPTPDEEMDRMAIEAANGEAWIIDGNYSRTIEYRLQRATMVVYLDLNRYICTYRALKRWVLNRGKTRPDLADDCPEKIDLEFLRYIFDYPKQSGRRIERILREREARRSGGGSNEGEGEVCEGGGGSGNGETSNAAYARVDNNLQVHILRSRKEIQRFVKAFEQTFEQTIY